MDYESSGAKISIDLSKLDKLEFQAAAIEMSVEARKRGLVFPLGAEAVDATHSAGEADATHGEDQAFRDKVCDFLDPEVELSAESQIEFMREFWGKLGFEVPGLDEGQQAKLTETIERNPGKRVIPSPLLSVNWRKSVARDARKAFPAQQFNADGEALWTPDRTETLYGRLLRWPESAVNEDRISYGLRYKSPTGEIVGREAFEKALLESGQAVRGANLDTWVFPVMDAQVHSKRTTYATASDLYKGVGPTEVPEALITMQILHQASGTPNRNRHVDFANEAIYELDHKGKPKALVKVAGVSWGPGSHQVVLRAWSADGQLGDSGVRGAESGLKP